MRTNNATWINKQKKACLRFPQLERENCLSECERFVNKLLNMLARRRVCQKQQKDSERRGGLTQKFFKTDKIVQF